MVFAFAFAVSGCATSRKTITQANYPGGRYPASSNECPGDKPCVFIRDFDGSQAVFVGENFKSTKQSSYQVNIYANGTYLEDVNTNSNGSFSYTTPAGKATYGTRIEVKVLNWEGPGRHWTGSATIERAQPPKQPDQPTQPPKQTYRMPEDQLIEYAKVQARTVANRVARTYGELEKWKYNFTMGFWQGTTAYEGMYQARVDYDNGVANGRERGEAPGYQAGAGEGRSQGGTRGSSIAQERFRAIVNTGRAPDLNLGEVPTPRFGGLSAPSGVCNSVGTKTSELERQLSNEMRVIRFGDDEYGYLAYDATIYSITFKEIYGYGNGKFEFVDSWFRTDAAWNEWIQNDLGGKYNKVNYRKLESDQASYFRAQFEREYDRSIDEKFYRKKTEYNATANARGQWYGVQIATRQKIDAGCTAGYNERYAPASVRGFTESFQSALRSNFDSTVKAYNSNPYVTIDGLRLVDGNQNGVFELGEAIGVEIGSYTNLGRVAARNLPVQLIGDGLDMLPSSEQISMEPSTSKAVNQKAMNLAKIREDVIADKAQAVTVAIGTMRESLSYTVSWAGAIQALATADSNTAATLKNFVMKNIQDEYVKTENAKEDIYKEGKTSKMLELVLLYERLPENQRATIRSMGPGIVSWQSTYKHAHNKWSTGKLRKNFAALAQRLLK